MIESFEFRGWTHELVLVTESSIKYIAERMTGDEWHDNLGRLIGVKFRYDAERGHFTEYAKIGHWVAFQTNKDTGEQIVQILNEAHANWLMDTAGSPRRKRHIPNRPRAGG